MATQAKGFDLRTIRLNKKGQVVSRQPYRLYIEKGVQKFERPPGSGNFYAPNGDLISAGPAAKEEKKKAAKDFSNEKEEIQKLVEDKK